MTDELYVWLKRRWFKDNHNKYHCYFEMWVKNITDSQIKGYGKQEKRGNVYE